MLSKGGKVSYTCPFCHSDEIAHVHIKPAWAALLRKPGENYTEKEWDSGVTMSEAHGECSNCNEWFHWCERIKKSLRKKNNDH